MDILGQTVPMYVTVITEEYVNLSRVLASVKKGGLDQDAKPQKVSFRIEFSFSVHDLEFLMFQWIRSLLVMCTM